MIKDFLNYQLKDDDTMTGGISFIGETVWDFIQYVEGLKLDDDISKLNKVLKENGIQTIKEDN